MKNRTNQFCSTFCCILFLGSATVFAQSNNTSATSSATQITKPIPVTWETFALAETHRTFNNYAKLGGFGKFFHLRAITSIDKQDVVRMNRDTRYSIGIFDLSTPLTITLPDAGERYIAMQVINEEEYTKNVLYSPGQHVFTKENVGSRYVCLIVRILSRKHRARVWI